MSWPTDLSALLCNCRGRSGILEGKAGKVVEDGAPSPVDIEVVALVEGLEDDMDKEDAAEEQQLPEASVAGSEGNIRKSAKSNDKSEQALHEVGVSRRLMFD